MNHERRIKELEKELERVKKILRTSGLLGDFIPLSQASKILDLNTWVIRDRIKADPKVQLNWHYKMNGNRYLININEYHQLMVADVRSKHL